MIFITKSLTLPISVLAPNLTGILVGHPIPQLGFRNEREQILFIIDNGNLIWMS